MCSTIIALRDFPASTPNQHNTSGQVRLDVVEDIVLTEQVSEDNGIGVFKSSGAYAMSLPYTSKNVFAFEVYRKGAGKYLDIPVVVRVDGIVIPEDTLRVIKVVPGVSIEVEVLRLSSWQEKAKAIRLNEIDGFQPFLWGETHVLNVWSNDCAYDGTNRGYYYPHIQFGAHWNSWADSAGHQVWSIENARAVPHLKALLERGFCKAGYRFSCPFLDTEQGKRLGAYLAEDSFSFSEPLVQVRNRMGFLENILRGRDCFPGYNRYRFGATKTTDQAFSLGPGSTFPAIKFTQEDYDTAETLAWSSSSGLGNGFWRNGASFAGYAGKWKVDVVLRISAATGFFGEIVLAEGTYNSGTGIHSPYSAAASVYNRRSNIFEINHPGGGDLIEYNFSLDFIGVAADLSEACLIDIAEQTTSYTIHAGSSIKATCEYICPIQKQYALVSSTFAQDTNIVVFPQSYFGNRTLMELFAGVAHTINGRVDETNRAIALHPLYPTQYSGTIEGFIVRESATNLQTEAVCESMAVSTDRAIKPCTVRLGFKEPTDAHIKRVWGDSPTLWPWEKRYDTGEPNCDGEEVRYNPFFEPTVEALQQSIASTTPGDEPVYMPVMTDNTESRVAYAIKPRVLVFLGYGDQRKSSAAAARKYIRYFSGTETNATAMAYASQSQTVPFLAVPIGAPEVRPAWDFIYGSSNGAASQELWAFWEKYLSNGARAIAQVTLFLSGIVNYLGLSPRRMYLFQADSYRFRGRVVKKGAFSPKQENVVVLELEEVNCYE